MMNHAGRRNEASGGGGGEVTQARAQCGDKRHAAEAKPPAALQEEATGMALTRDLASRPSLQGEGAGAGAR